MSNFKNFENSTQPSTAKVIASAYYITQNWLAHVIYITSLFYYEVNCKIRTRMIIALDKYISLFFAVTQPLCHSVVSFPARFVSFVVLAVKKGMVISVGRFVLQAPTEILGVVNRC